MREYVQYVYAARYWILLNMVKQKHPAVLLKQRQRKQPEGSLSFYLIST